MLWYIANQALVLEAIRGWLSFNSHEMIDTAFTKVYVDCQKLQEADISQRFGASAHDCRKF
jgi:hypothetical protein